MEGQKHVNVAPTYANLLEEAVREPGTISQAYSMFHNYSIGNAFAAWSQCAARGIQPGPIATYKRWKELGRQVRKGEHALVLCMPVPVKFKEEKDDGTEEERSFTRFIWRPNWFVLSQTDGETEPKPVEVPGWDAETAFAELKIERVPFTMLNGNAQGYAVARKVAVSPIAENPLKTTLHELAHVVLGHTTKGERSDTGELTYADGEVEAEGTAYICASVLGQTELEKSRGYLQTWLSRTGEHQITETSARRIFTAADKILKAGRKEAV